MIKHLVAAVHGQYQIGYFFRVCFSYSKLARVQYKPLAYIVACVIVLVREILLANMIE